MPLIVDDKDENLFGFIKKNSKGNSIITKLMELTSELKSIDNKKDKNRNPKLYNRKMRILKDILSIIAPDSN